jgi:hypothetical protein
LVPSVGAEFSVPEAFEFCFLRLRFRFLFLFRFLFGVGFSPATPSTIAGDVDLSVRRGHCRFSIRNLIFIRSILLISLWFNPFNRLVILRLIWISRFWTVCLPRICIVLWPVWFWPVGLIRICVILWNRRFVFVLLIFTLFKDMLKSVQVILSNNVRVIRNYSLPL